jgi:hypothetical protein
MWDLEILPQAIGVAGGSFDETGWLDPKLHVWTKHAHKWVSFPEDAEVLQESNLGKWSTAAQCGQSCLTLTPR